MDIRKISRKNLLIGLLGTLALVTLVTAMAPVERTLGERVRLVYFHGAWVWAGKVAFASASAAGLIGLLLPGRNGSRRTWQRASLALGWAGMLFWLTYLPLSLLVQQMNWGGIFWDEPRWKIPLMFGIAGILLQAGMFMLEDFRLAALGNLLFGVALWWALGTIQNVLHPDSPIFGSNSLSIQLFFGAILAVSLFFGAILTRLLFSFVPSRWK
jgi:hypothetical protein